MPRRLVQWHRPAPQWARIRVTPGLAHFGGGEAAGEFAQYRGDLRGGEDIGGRPRSVMRAATRLVATATVRAVPSVLPPRRVIASGQFRGSSRTITKVLVRGVDLMGPKVLAYECDTGPDAPAARCGRRRRSSAGRCRTGPGSRPVARVPAAVRCRARGRVLSGRGNAQRGCGPYSDHGHQNVRRYGYRCPPLYGPVRRRRPACPSGGPPVAGISANSTGMPTDT